ncbi:hypothetical protein AVEN_21413-1 [Araneus ventricosus]|uniref:Uncharacterized protein n=1 Tax=Araneus ventricosus TaxID=182803 RepID=A0A4Y2X549_ARAVE|nr:hypothetical protein AVEN_21413-1 [Araneus ventricosus]
MERKKPYVYRIPEALKGKLDEQIGELLDVGLIEESDSDIAHPVVWVYKKDGSVRLCVDYRTLNAVTKPHDFPMENAVDLIAQYRFNVLPFGLKTAAATCQRVMNNSLKEFSEFEWAYIDDLAIYSADIGTHLKHLDSHPLTELTKKRAPEIFDWKEIHQTAFQDLKDKLSKTPELYTPTLEKLFIIHSDASQIGIGACLSQECDGKQYPICYASQKLTIAQQHWPMIEREAYAIVWSLKKFEPWIFG